MAERRCATGVEGLAVEATRQLSRRKCHPLTVEQKSRKARVVGERRSVIKLTAEQKSEKARVEAERRSVIKLTADQNSEKAKVEAERRSIIKLIDEQTSKKARVEAKRWFGESSQAAAIRWIDKRHSYAPRSMTVANRAISNV